MPIALVSNLRHCTALFSGIRTGKVCSCKLTATCTRTGRSIVTKWGIRHLGSSSSSNKRRRPMYGGESSELYDVIIAGGGMVGQAMACALGQEPALKQHKILLLEGSSKPDLGKPPENYSNRVCALNHGSVNLLDAIGAWKDMVQQRVKPFCRMQVWDACSEAVITFNNDDLSEDIAYIVENDVTNKALSKQLEQLSDSVQVMYETMVCNMAIPKMQNVQEDSWVDVELKNGEILKTRLLIGADGANSTIRQLSGIDVFRNDYEQSGVVATLQLSEPTENNVAWQRFLPSGPIAMLPLSDTESSLVWSNPNDKAKSLMELSDEQFVEEVNNAFWDNSNHDPSINRIGEMFHGLLSTVFPQGSSVRQLPPSVVGIDPGSRGRFPLALGHALHYVKPRIALIGDAAHRIHPMAGQGVNLGFGDVASLTDILVEASEIGKDLGSLSHLLQYETSRQQHILPIMATIHGLHHLYSSQNQAVVLMRSLGLQATNAIPSVKNSFISGASY